MHVGKMMARLGPKTSRLDIGSGGSSELTPQDIAAALGMVTRGLGRELLCRIWWPDGATLSASDLDDHLMEAQLGEWRRRMDAMVTAQIKLHVATTAIARQRAQSDLEAAKLHMWPRLGPESSYAVIRKAVLVEMSAACLCSSCKGHGRMQGEDAKIGLCSWCRGTGRKRVSDRQRADLIKCEKNNYKERWGAVYEWTYQVCEDALGPAHAEMRSKVA